jgi:hypothetical protein
VIFTPEWHDLFIGDEGLETYGAHFFENYLANPQSKHVRLTKNIFLLRAAFGPGVFRAIRFPP